MVQQLPAVHRCLTESTVPSARARDLDASDILVQLSNQLAKQKESSDEEISAPQEDCSGRLPTLPSDVVEKILELVKQSWRERPRMTAKDEVREWTQYSLVNKAWQAAFQDMHLCIEFYEAPSKQQVAWLRSTRTPIQRVTFLPSCTPCKSTASAFISASGCQQKDVIRLRPGKIELPPYMPARRIGTVVPQYMVTSRNEEGLAIVAFAGQAAVVAYNHWEYVAH